MTDDQHGEGAPQGGGRWDPLPHGDYDDGATAFVKLPEGGIDALLAAPGHGYVPPPITVSPATAAGTDPAATGSWTMPPTDNTRWPDPNGVPQDAGADDRFTYNPAATQQWAYEEPPVPAAGHDVTGQWSIPVAGGDLPDESGEFTTSSLVEQWGGTPPATLPGGAAAPWATEPAGQSWGGQPTAPAPAEEHPAGPARDAVRENFARTGAYPDSPQSYGAGVPGAGGQDPRVAHGARPDAPEAPAPRYAHKADGTSAPAEAAGPAEAAETAHGAAEAPEGLAEPPAGPEATMDADGGPEGAETATTGDDSGTSPQPAAALHDDHPLASYVLRVNGADRPVSDAWIGESLLYVLRERLGLAGAKDGCSQGECGACNIQVDGRLVASCLVPAVTAAGSEVRTVEGLAVDGQPSDVQRALAKCGAVQCGFCVPGMAMTMHDLLEGNPAPTELEARQALCGNLCRCSGYRGVLNAVQEVVAEREAHASADVESDADEARIPHQAGPGTGGVNPSAFEASGPPVRHDQVPHEQPYDQSYGQDGGQA
ncbi:2Fe-2S iron-sulfur cluster-binding protein [Streptomyces sp. NPDC001982]|uniref:2Fe-2S iron-sulfur cluster-binding protein n=1 Tax=unclassified Streptomyces TaxID=2593676 RepID=UPI00331F1A77